MSSLLKEAIIDAKALREAALKNAEASVIDKYSDEVRSTLEQLLEQDELGLGAELSDTAAVAPADEALEEELEDVPYAATSDLSDMQGSNLTNIPTEDEEVQFNLDLGALRESVEALKAELSEEEEINIEEAIEEESEDLSEEIEIEEEQEELSEEDLVDSIVEKLMVDMGADLSGWAGRSASDKKYQMEKEMAHRRSTELQQELEDLKKAQEELVFENKQLQDRLQNYEQATSELKETLQSVNLSNARLLYTNRALRSTSFNERQKNKIVEAISRADSVSEAKTIYETLQSTVESAGERHSPKSLSEAIHRPSSVIRASRQESTQTDAFAERMRRLAGIK
jgi:hypothetical protein